MVNRTSALAGHYTPGHYGLADEAGVQLTQLPAPELYQIALWPDQFEAGQTAVARLAGLKKAPLPNEVRLAAKGTLMRVEPLKWWLLNPAKAPEIAPEAGTLLDLSHSRTHLRLSGPRACDLLNRFVPLDLRPQSFQQNQLATTGMHHIPICLWRTEAGFEILLPRAFALSLFEQLLDTGKQFGIKLD